MPRVFRQSAFWAALICVIALGVGGLVVLSQNKARDAADAETRSMVAARGPFVAIANGRADVDGGVVHVAARRPGIVREVFVEEGQQVVRGQVLAQQEDDEPRLAAASAAADLHQAKAQIAVSEVRLSAAQREYARLQSLSTSNIIAAQRLDQAADVIREAQAALQAQRAAVGSAEARLSEAKYNLDLTVIRAPMDGRIVRRFANPGEGASTLNVSTMFDLEPKGRRIVRAELSESALPFVDVGQSVQIALESDPSRTYPGKVVRRAAMFGARKLESDDPTERSDERVVEVVVSADGAPLLIGQRVLVKFLRPTEQPGA
jgi:RND family efflux transporter MFP subunit